MEANKSRSFSQTRINQVGDNPGSHIILSSKVIHSLFGLAMCDSLL